MSNKIVYILLLVFLAVCAVPFRNVGVLKLNPNAKVETKETDKFILTANKPEYTKPYNLEYTEASSSEGIEPDINGESAVLIDIQANKIIYQKEPKKKLPVASLVKVMTAIITVEHSDLQDTTTISDKASSVGENTMGLEEGEIFTNLDLLYGLILNSANDSAFALSETVAGNTDDFVYYMNRKAELIGAKNTLFVDPSGLNPEKLDYYSTAIDMAKITQYSLENHPILREIYQTVSKEIPYTKEHGYKSLENQTNLLTTYPGVKGVKTGYTEDAGLCLITYAENDGVKLLGVILNSDDRKSDAVKLLDYGFLINEVEIDHPLLN